ncbi:MAG: hypothetical protein FIA95_04180, partial [Gemmatimonadetes bacterium]|nr:hypothetical protein [Gemmatimonadota bacterium]
MKEKSKPTKTAPREVRGERSVQGPLRVPGWLPAVLVVAVTAVLFRELSFSSRRLWGSDPLSLGYVSRAFYGDALRGSGAYPLWMPGLLGGTPFLEALAGGDSLYPPSVFLLLLMETYRSLGWKLVIHVAAGGLFMFGWARALDRSRAASLVAALGYAVAPFMVSFVHPGHDGKLFVTALAPLLFWALEATFRRRGLLPYAGVAAVVGLVLLTTHFQMAYFLFGLAGIYYGFRSWLVWREARAGGAPGPRAARAAGGRFALFLAAAVLGAALSGVQLLPAFRYVTE